MPNPKAILLAMLCCAFGSTLMAQSKSKLAGTATEMPKVTPFGIGIQHPSFPIDWGGSGNGGAYSGIKCEATGEWIYTGDGPCYDNALCTYHTCQALTPTMACYDLYVAELAACDNS